MRPTRTAGDAYRSLPGMTYYAGAGLVLLAYAWHCYAVNYVADDSFITFRYVKHFVAGQGIVYNPGERVEGYTNFLWLLLLSGFAWMVPAGDLLLAAQILGVACGAAVILLLLLASRHLHRQAGPFALVAGALLAFNASFCAWSTGGLETTLFALLVFGSVYAYATALESGRNLTGAGMLFALAALTRPEGVLLYAVASAHLLWTTVRGGKQQTSARLLAWALGFAAIYAPYYVWRLSYYGYPFPNTFYAKVGSGFEQYRRGARYLVDYLKWDGALVLPFLLVLLLQRKRPHLVNVCLAVVAAQFTYIVYVGGDGLAFFRFVACVGPLLCLLAQEGFTGAYGRCAARVRPAHGRWLRWAATGLLAVALSFEARQTLGVVLFPAAHRWYEPQSGLTFPGTGSDHRYLWFDNYFVDRLKIAAQWLETHAPPGAVIAATPAGAIGYHTTHNVIDMLGLNDVHIAHRQPANVGAGRAGHEKGDGAYVLARSPDYILLGNVAVLPHPIADGEMAGKLVQRSEREIWAAADFHQRYERVSVQLGDSGAFRFFTFYRRR
ncbi:MAG: glycosyltransferase family 39 protein [Deltaproteobacteria bacterium]|nr:glycosyltransferase family 39 protein [Deltaproteobacteria bacterium]